MNARSSPWYGGQVAAASSDQCSAFFPGDLVWVNTPGLGYGRVFLWDDPWTDNRATAQVLQGQACLVLHSTARHHRGLTGFYLVFHTVLGRVGWIDGSWLERL